VTRLPILLLGAMLTLLTSCARNDAPNIVLVALDTVGAEHLGTEVPGLGHTPNLDRLAAEGIRFERAFSTAPWTQPAIASIFTSRMPSSHGVLRLNHVLPSAAVTLAERMRSEGYTTAGFVTHHLLAEKLGFAQGFAHWNEEHVGGHRDINSRELTDSVIAWLDANRGDEPFFLFVHYFDPHYAYHHHEAHDLTSDYDGPLVPAMNIWTLRNMRDELSPTDVDYLIGLHREEIAFTDHHVGRLLEHLRALGVDDRTVVAVVGDHGEEFMRHGWIGHTRTLYDELIRVPLILRLPGAAGARVESSPVSVLDLAPTLLEVAGAEPDPEAQGISLLLSLMEAAPLPKRDLLAEVSFEGKRRDVGKEKTVFLTTLIRGDLKIVHDLASDRFTVFDRSTDPEELVDLAASHPEAESLRAALLAWEAQRGRDAQGTARLLEPDPEELERLRALGYVEPPRSGERQPDPAEGPTR
jgi:arylsulfatase A-like enzyme